MSLAQAMRELSKLAEAHCFVPRGTDRLTWRANTPEIWKLYYQALVRRVDSCLDNSQLTTFQVDLAKEPQ